MVLSQISNKFHKFQPITKPGRGFNLLISNEDTDVVMNIIEPLEKSGLLIDDAIEAVKYEIKKRNKEVDFLVLLRHLWLMHWYNL